MAVDLRALRAMLTPEIRIAPGRGLMARVVATGPSGRGSLSIAGLLIDAQLPAAVRAGDELRLLVTDVNEQRVLLTIAERGAEQTATGRPPAGAQEAAAQAAGQLPTHGAASQTPDAAQLLAIPVALPGGGSVAVTERDAGGRRGSDAAARTVTLRYDAPALGAVDLRFALSPGALALNVTVEPDAIQAAHNGAGELRDALAQALDRPVSVTVSPRRRPLDVYA